MSNGERLKHAKKIIDLKHVMFGKRTNPCPTARDKINETIGLETDQGFSDRSATHAQTAGNFRFRGLESRRQGAV